MPPEVTKMPVVPALLAPHSTHKADSEREVAESQSLKPGQSVRIGLSNKGLRHEYFMIFLRAGYTNAWEFSRYDAHDEELPNGTVGVVEDDPAQLPDTVIQRLQKNPGFSPVCPLTGKPTDHYVKVVATMNEQEIRVFQKEGVDQNARISGADNHSSRPPQRQPIGLPLREASDY